MAALTSVKDGDFRDPTTWSPAQVPTGSDTFYLYHRITMTGTNRVGTGSSGSAVWYVGGSLVPDATQVITNNTFATDSNSDGLADNFSLTGTYTGTPTTSIVTGYKQETAQRIQYTGVSGDSAGDIYLTSDYSSAIFKYTLSGLTDTARNTFLYNTGSSSGVSFAVVVDWYDASNNLISTTNTALTATNGEWYEYVYSSTCPSGAVKYVLKIGATGVDNGDVVDFKVDWIRGYNISYTQLNTNWAPANGSVQLVNVSEHPDQLAIFEVRSSSLTFAPANSSTTVIDFDGAPKTNYRTIVQANAGTNYIVVSELDTDWKVGDSLLIESGHSNGSYSNQAELSKVIAEIRPESKTIVLTSNLLYTHNAGARVYNYTRNLVLRSLSGYFSNVNITNITSQAITFDNCQFSSFGNTPDAGGYGIYISGSGTVVNFNKCVFDNLQRYGLRPINYASIVVDQCLFVNCNYALSLQGSAKSCQITNSYFTKNSNGIISGYSAGGISSTIENCVFNDTNGYAINIQSSTNLRFYNCRFFNNSCDINVSSGTNNFFEFRNNIIGETNSGALMPSTTNINFSSPCYANGKFIDTVFKSLGTKITNTYNLMPGSNVAFDDSSGIITYQAFGSISPETSIVRSGSTALKMTGAGAGGYTTFKANAIVQAGSPVSITGYMRMDANYMNELIGASGNFEVDSNSDGMADNTAYYKSGTSTPVCSLSTDSYKGTYSQKVVWTGVSGDANSYKQFYVTTSQSIPVGRSIYYEFYVKGSVTGTVTVQPVVAILNGSKSWISSTYGTSFTLSNSWVKVSGVYNNFSSSGTYAGIGIALTSFDSTDSATFYIDDAVCYIINSTSAVVGGRPELPSITLSGAGMTPQTWTMTNTPDEWVQFTLSGTPTETTLVDVSFNTKNNYGNVYLDDVVVAGVAIDTGTFDYYYEGSPINVLFATPVSTNAIASAVWEESASAHTTPGTTGEALSNANAPTVEEIRQEMDTNSQIAKDAKQAKLNTY